MSAAARIVALAEAAEAVRRWRAAGERVALGLGDFDLLDAAQARQLGAARAGADRLVVAVRDDAAAAARGGRGRPVLPAGDRAALVAALRGVDRVVVVADESAAAPGRALGCDAAVEISPGRDAAAAVRAAHGAGA